MPLEAPRLDDRSFEDLVQEARRRIPLYTPEWTDHNLSDPGITLIELFAWLIDIMLYRVNRVPEKHYIKFMELIGMQLREPTAAETRTTFWLSAPQEVNIDIPEGTQVATTRTETEPAIVFSTKEKFIVRVSELSRVLTSTGVDASGRTFREVSLQRLQAGFEGAFIFNESPKEGDALYLGFKTDLSHHILGLEMDVDVAGGAGIDPTRPPYVWQGLSSATPIEWTDCEPDMDDTKGFNIAGLMRMHLPKLVEGEINGVRGYWVRCRLIDPGANVPKYRKSPLLRKLNAASWGGTMPAMHAQVVREENLGRSEGTPGQSFFLASTPVLKRTNQEHLIVRISNREEEIWTEVPDFAESGPDDKHYTIDSGTGELRFGPAIRQRDGSMKRYGSFPAQDTTLIMHRYRHGGGIAGNLQKGALSILITSIPYVAKVSNRINAIGGLDRENIEDMKLRVPGYLRSLRRAVTAADYEYLAHEASPGKIARVFALQPPNSSIGEVKVLLVPRVNNNPAEFIEPKDLDVPKELREVVRAYLDERRLLTSRLDVTTPAYYWVASRVRIRVSDHADPDAVRDKVSRRLYEFLNPITGGLDGKGWQFGRDLHSSDLVIALQNIPGIDFIRSIEIFPVTLRDNTPTIGAAVQTLETVAHGVIASFRHDILTDQD